MFAHGTAPGDEVVGTLGTDVAGVPLTPLLASQIFSCADSKLLDQPRATVQ